MRLGLAVIGAAASFTACFTMPEGAAEVLCDSGSCSDAAPQAAVEMDASTSPPTGFGEASDAAAITTCPGVDLSLAPRLTTQSGTFLATGVSQRTTYSIDGVNWVTHAYSAPLPADASVPSGDLQAVVSGNGILVAAATSGIATSTDGRTWDPRDYPESSPYVTYRQGFHAVAFGKDRFVVSASPPFHPQSFFHSSDGITWLPSDLIDRDIYGETIYAVVFADDKFVAVGRKRRTIVSDDGIAWRDDRHGSTDGNLAYTALAFANGTWVAAGLRSTLAWSENGVDWNDVGNPEIVGDFWNLVFDGQKFLTCARPGCYTSPDGRTWSRGTANAGDPRPTRALVVHAGLYVGLDLPATLLTSSDGLAWSPVYCGEAPALLSLLVLPP